MGGNAKEEKTRRMILQRLFARSQRNLLQSIPSYDTISKDNRNEEVKEWAQVHSLSVICMGEMMPGAKEKRPNRENIAQRGGTESRQSMRNMKKGQRSFWHRLWKKTPLNWWMWNS